jgi:hypothetical protein
MSLTASPHDAGQLITRIRAKCRFLTPTKEKFWQSLLLACLSRPIKGTLTHRWEIYKYTSSLEGQVFNSFSISLSLSCICLLFLLKHWSTCKYHPPPPVVICCSTPTELLNGEGFVDPTTFLITC